MSLRKPLLLRGSAAPTPFDQFPSRNYQREFLQSIFWQEKYNIVTILNYWDKYKITPTWEHFNGYTPHSVAFHLKNKNPRLFFLIKKAPSSLISKL